MTTTAIHHRRKANGRFVESDHERRSKSESAAFRLAEAELMSKNAALPLPTLYKGVDEVKASARAAEIEANMIRAAKFEAKGNWRGAAVYRAEAERLKGAL